MVLFPLGYSLLDCKEIFDILQVTLQAG
jgi:hypothetical protein